MDFDAVQEKQIRISYFFHLNSQERLLRLNTAIPNTLFNKLTSFNKRTKNVCRAQNSFPNTPKLCPKHPLRKAKKCWFWN